MRALLACSLGLVLCLSMAAPVSAQFTPTSLCDVNLDGDGNCEADNLGAAVSVEGVIVAWKEFGARGAGAIWDPTTDCCLAIFDITDAPVLPTGQWVRIEGWIGSFAGLVEIVDNPADGTMDPVVTDLGTNYGSVPAMPMQGADLQDGSALAEAKESCLIEICGVFDTTDTVFGGNVNYNFSTTDGNTVIVRIDVDTDLVGAPVPGGVISVVGILGQFDGFGANPCGGYQVLPRSTADVAQSACSPIGNVDSSWGELKSRFDGNE